LSHQKVIITFLAAISIVFGVVKITYVDAQHVERPLLALAPGGIYIPYMTPYSDLSSQDSYLNSDPVLHPPQHISIALSKESNVVTVKKTQKPLPVQKQVDIKPEKNTEQQVHVLPHNGFPVPGGRITQGLHGRNGIDFGAPLGTPVHSVAGGSVVVVMSSGWNGGYGSYVIIDHLNGTRTLYAHLGEIIVEQGDTVHAGQQISVIGMSGRTTGPHLHFEVQGGSNPFIE